MKDQQIARLEQLAHRLNGSADRIFDRVTAILKPITEAVPELRKASADMLATAQARFQTAPPSRPAMPARVVLPPRPAQRQPAVESGVSEVGNTGLRRMLVALAQRNGLSARQLALRTAMAASGGSFRTYLSQGRTSGWIAGSSERLTITDAGLAALGEYEPLPEGAALQEHWLRELGNTGAAAMLRALCEVYPKPLTYDELGSMTNMAPSGGSFRTYLSKLRTLELIEGRGELRASEELFS